AEEKHHTPAQHPNRTPRWEPTSVGNSGSKAFGRALGQRSGLILAARPAAPSQPRMFRSLVGSTAAAVGTRPGPGVRELHRKSACSTPVLWARPREEAFRR